MADEFQEHERKKVASSTKQNAFQPTWLLR